MLLAVQHVKVSTHFIISWQTLSFFFSKLEKNFKLLCLIYVTFVVFVTNDYFQFLFGLSFLTLKRFMFLCGQVLYGLFFKHPLISNFTYVYFLLHSSFRTSFFSSGMIHFFLSRYIAILFLQFSILKIHLCLTR